MTWVAAGTAAVTIVGGMVGRKRAKDAEAKAQQERDQRKITDLWKNINHLNIQNYFK